MPSPFAQTLIDIAVGHLLKPAAPVSWVSENGVRFHVETSASAAANGQSWLGLCGATGDCYFIYSAKVVQPAMRCATCQELSTTGIQDVAGQGKGQTPIGSLCAGDEGVGGAISPPCTHGVCVASGAAESIANIPTDSQISLIERLIPKTLPDADLCQCGQPAVHTCPCQAKVCVAHLYDGEGQHVEAQGFCGECVTLIQTQNSSRYPDPASHPRFA